MIAHLGEVLLAVTVAFLAGSVIGWVLYRWIDHTDFEFDQRDLSDALGRGLRLNPRRTPEAMRLREEELRRRDEDIRRRDEQRAIERRRAGASHLKKHVKSSTRAAAWSEARDERIMREVAGTITPSETLAAAKTAALPAPVPQPLALDTSESRRTRTVSVATKVNDVWTLGDVESEPAEETDGLPSATVPARANSHSADRALVPGPLGYGPVWPISQAVRQLPSPTRQLALASPGAIALRGLPSSPALMPLANPDEIWSDSDSARSRVKRPVDRERPSVAPSEPEAGQPVSSAPEVAGDILDDDEFNEALEAAATREAAETDGSTPPQAQADDEVAASQPFLFPTAPARKDNLRQIRGIGHGFERKLNEAGVYQLVQIANWTPGEAMWIGEALEAPGRVEREDWVAQAAELLSAGRRKPGSSEAEVVSDP